MFPSLVGEANIKVFLIFEGSLPGALRIDLLGTAVFVDLVVFVAFGKPHYKQIPFHLGISEIEIGPPPPHSNEHSGAIFSGHILPF